MHWSEYRYGPYREGRKYRKRPHHHRRKEALLDLWREEKLRDYRRRRGRRGGMQIIKALTKVRRRQWERRQIYHERYDDFSVIGTWEAHSLFEPWCWD